DANTLTGKITVVILVRDIYPRGKDTISVMEEMQCQVSAADANKINVSWCQQHLDAIQKRTETKEKCSLLMKGKANNSLVNIAAKRDFKETRIEILTAQE
nr:phospholipase-like protein [Tanacetum cinerariifolium]